MVLVGMDIPQEGWNSAELIDHHIDLSIVEQVTECRTARRQRRTQPRAFACGNEFELSISFVAKKQGPLGKGRPPVGLVHFRVNMTVRKEEISPAIVVKIQETGSPAEERDRYFGNSGLIADVRVIPVSVITVKRFVIIRECGGREIEKIIVQIIPDRNSHGRGFAAVFIQSKSGRVTYIFEGAVPLVQVQEVGGRIVGHDQVGFRVIVYVREDGCQPVESAGILHTRLFADVSEGAVSVVVKQMIWFTPKAARSAHDIYRAKLASGKRYCR